MRAAARVQGQNWPRWVWPESWSDMPFFGGNLDAVGGVGEKNACARAVEAGVAEGLAEVFAVSGVAIGDADDLQTVELDSFVVEDADAGA